MNIFDRLRTTLVIRSITKAYKQSKSKEKDRDWDWRCVLRDRVLKSGWKVSHPGSDKWVAKRGSFVVKWKGDLIWSDDPIGDELDMFKGLREAGLEQHVPEVYLDLNRELIIEQRIDDKPSYMDIENFRDELHDRGIKIIDLCRRNAGIVNGVVKVIDGQIHRDL